VVKNQGASSAKIAAKAPDCTIRETADPRVSEASPTLKVGVEDIESSERDSDDDGDGDASKNLFDTRDTTPIVLTESQYPRTWKHTREMIVNEMLSQPRSGGRIQIIGTTNAGKETFARYLINTLLNPPEELGLEPLKSVALLHLDPTKPGYGQPGHLTLLKIKSPLRTADEMSPTSMIQAGVDMLRSIPVGFSCQKEDSSHFLSATKELLSVFGQLNVTTPLIISCPSFDRESDRGMDMRTTQKLTNLLTADYICCLAYKASHTAEALLAVTQAIQDHAAMWEMKALSDLRLSPTSSLEDVWSRALQDCFHSHVSTDGSMSLDDMSLSLRKPYAISYTSSAQDGSQDISGAFIFGDLPPNHPFMVSRILNGSVVAIVICEGQNNDNRIAIGEGDRIPYFINDDGASPNPSMLLRGNNVGLGLIRSIDCEHGIMYIITHEHVAKRLENVPSKEIVLVHGIVDCPGWAYRDDLRAGMRPCYLGKAKKGMQTVKSRRFKKKD
jgi:hypothetical protein